MSGRQRDHVRAYGVFSGGHSYRDGQSWFHLQSRVPDSVAQPAQFRDRTVDIYLNAHSLGFLVYCMVNNERARNALLAAADAVRAGQEKAHRDGRKYDTHLDSLLYPSIKGTLVEGEPA